MVVLSGRWQLPGRQPLLSIRFSRYQNSLILSKLEEVVKMRRIDGLHIGRDGPRGLVCSAT